MGMLNDWRSLPRQRRSEPKISKKAAAVEAMRAKTLDECEAIARYLSRGMRGVADVAKAHVNAGEDIADEIAKLQKRNIPKKISSAADEARKRGRK